MNSRVIATLEARAQPTFDDMGADEVAIRSAGGCDLMIAVENRSTCRAVHLDRGSGSPRRMTVSRPACGTV